MQTSLVFPKVPSGATGFNNNNNLKFFGLFHSAYFPYEKNLEQN